MAQQKLSKEDKICYGALVLIIIVIIGYAGYWAVNAWGDDDDDDGPPAEKVSEGDIIQVRYTAKFEQDNRIVVFDTTEEDVAQDNRVKKSLGFTDSGQYGPVDWQLVRKTENTGVVNTLFLKLLDKKEGWSGTIEVPDTDNYGGIYDQDLVISVAAQVDIPTYENMTRDDFEFLYPNSGSPENGKLLEHYIWGWETTIIHMDNVTDQIMMKNQPLLGSDVGKASFPLPWDVTVTSVSESEITITNDFKDDLLGESVDHLMLATYYAEVAQVELLKQEKNQLDSPGIIRSVSNGITIDFNHEVCGHAVILDLEIVSVTKGAFEPEP